MKRDDKDRSGKWMIGHFGGSILRLNGSPEVMIRQCRERIDHHAPKEWHDNLLAVTQVMTKLRYNDVGLLAILGGRKIMIESPLIQEIVDEAKVRTQQMDIVAVLEARFGRVPRRLIAAVNSVKDERALTKLIAVAVKCSNLDTFQRQMTSKQ